MEEGPKLRRDVDFSQDKYSVNDSACLAVLSSYKSADFIDSGVHGVALKVLKDGIDTAPLVVKIMDRGDADSRAEIVKSLRVDERLSTWLPAFVRIHGWLGCGPVTAPEWIEQLKRVTKELSFDPLTDQCYYLVSHFGFGIALKKYRFTSRLECLSFLFELFYALSAAHDKYGFRHNDLHSGNVIVTMNVTEPRVYHVGEHEYVITSKIRPTIIDFGLSTFGPEDELADATALYINDHGRRAYEETRPNPQYLMIEYLNWLRATVTVYDPASDEWITTLDDKGVPVRPQRDVYKLMISIAPDYQTRELAPSINSLKTMAMANTSLASIISSAVFESLIRVPEQPPPPKRLKENENAGCMICGRLATQCFEQAPSYRFCDRKSCPASMGAIGALLQ